MLDNQVWGNNSREVMLIHVNKKITKKVFTDAGLSAVINTNHHNENPFNIQRNVLRVIIREQYHTSNIWSHRDPYHGWWHVCWQPTLHTLVQLDPVESYLQPCETSLAPKAFNYRKASAITMATSTTMLSSMDYIVCSLVHCLISNGRKMGSELLFSCQLKIEILSTMLKV